MPSPAPEIEAAESDAAVADQRLPQRAGDREPRMHHQLTIARTLAEKLMPAGMLLEDDFMDTSWASIGGVICRFSPGSRAIDFRLHRAQHPSPMVQQRRTQHLLDAL